VQIFELLGRVLFHNIRFHDHIIASRSGKGGGFVCGKTVSLLCSRYLYPATRPTSRKLAASGTPCGSCEEEAGAKSLRAARCRPVRIGCSDNKWCSAA
jgi:hypothetical protein